MERHISPKKSWIKKIRKTSEMEMRGIVLITKNIVCLVLMIALASIFLLGSVQAQTAPVPRAVVSTGAAPEAMSDMLTPLQLGENFVSIDGAEWLQLQFVDFQLGNNGILVISDTAGQSQTFTQNQLQDWEGLTAVFNSSKLTISLISDETTPGESEKISATIGEIIIGLSTAEMEDGAFDGPQPLHNLFGDDLKRYIPSDPPVPFDNSGEASLEEDEVVDTICGSDNRVSANHPLVGRIMPIGCTGWIIQGGAILTAGHCISSSTKTVEFNVPASKPNGTTVSPAVRNQYKVITSSIVKGYTGIGNDWAMFRVLPNTETGLMPSTAQGGNFKLSNTANPSKVRITGYGVDGPAPPDGSYGNPPPRNADNQTLQTNSGNLTENTVTGSSLAKLRYKVDSQGGNSGGPVIVAGNNNLAIGIHTNGGCSSSGSGANAGTSFRNQTLWKAINAFTSTDDIIWQHRNGQVHFWPMQDGKRLGGINIYSRVDGSWHLMGAGDVNGDGTDDIIWQHRNGQVHYWPIKNGKRQGGINIHSPVGGDWHLMGVGDINGDGTDDIVWQHRNGQVHYWPIKNGKRQDGINIYSPVGGNWHLMGVGDVNGDGTDDIVWQHRNGQVHYWPIKNGKRQGGINIHSPVGGDWHLMGAGDVNGDSTDDIVWQHRNGQVHYWPIKNGKRQGGINIYSPVGGDWHLVGVGNVN